jgi:hypothetical protein
VRLVDLRKAVIKHLKEGRSPEQVAASAAQLRTIDLFEPVDQL